jgi:hypothetical protein
MIARWKGIIEEINFRGSIMPSNIIENLYLEKLSFGPSKWPRKLKTAKNSKLPNLPENYFEQVGKGGWPPISTWIIYIGHPNILRFPTSILILEKTSSGVLSFKIACGHMFSIYTVVEVDSTHK